jgi:superfamily I DNA/RNA helicase
MKPTEEQQEINDSFVSLKSGECLKAIAFAGSGKTSTLKICATNRKERGVYLAFNQSIAEEARSKLGRTKCDAKTMHGLAFGAMRGIMDKPAKLNAKTIINSEIMNRFHVPSVRGWGDYRVASAVNRTMASFAASADDQFNEGHATAALIEALGDPDFISSEEKADVVRDVIDQLAEPLKLIAENYWVECMEDGQFSHDMYLKMLDLNKDLRHRAFARFKYLMIDEAQDINPVQRSIITKTGLPILAVGDPYQQIYSWRGAENALQQLPGKELYLTKSFRFGDNIAQVARHILSQIPGGGPEKHLIGGGPGDVSDHKGPQGAVICRTNIGMLDEAIKYLNKGYRVQVDNVDALLADAMSAQALHQGRPDQVKSPELKQFDTWEELEATAEEGADPGLSKLVNLVRSHRVPDVERLAKHQSKETGKPHLVVYTGHRSKGLEFPAVQLGDDWPNIDTMRARYKAAEMKSEKHVTLAREAFNTLYVASTRAMLRCKGYGRILKPEPEEHEQGNMVPVYTPE